MAAPWVERLRDRAAHLKTAAHALYFAYRDPRTPWYARLWGALVVAYALSPIDLIPDFIPIIGYLDDLILVPAGIALAVRMIPREVMAEARLRAAEQGTPGASKVGLALVGAVWLAVILWLLRTGIKLVGGG